MASRKSHCSHVNKSRLISREQENKLSSDWKHDSFSAPQVLMMGWLPTLPHLFHASYWPWNKVKLMQNGVLACQPATSLLASNNTASLSTLASAHGRAPLGSKTFKTREQATSTQKQREVKVEKPRLRGLVQHSKTS